MSTKDKNEKENVNKPLVQIQGYRIGAKTAPAETDVNLISY